MKKIVNLKYLGVFIGGLLLLTAGRNVKQFKGNTSLPTPQESAFHRIPVVPELVPHIKNNYADLRIIDSNFNEVPYMISREVATTPGQRFRSLPILINAQTDNQTSTRIIVHNEGRKAVDKLVFKLSNAVAQKTMSLEGSNDEKHWYVIKERFLLHSVYDHENTITMETLEFPLSDYEYLKFDIDDSSSAPLRILEAGYYDNTVSRGQYQAVPTIWFQKDSTDQTTVVRVCFDGEQVIDRLKLELDGPAYFHRNVTMSIMREERIKKRVNRYLDVQHSFQLSSIHENDFILPRIGADTLYLTINNGDNPPLEVKSVKALQLMSYLNAHLEKGGQYHLYFGDDEARPPDYDLAHFADQIPANAPLLTPGPLELRPGPADLEREVTDEIWVWIILVAVAGLLLLMSVKMVKEMNPKGNG